MILLFALPFCFHLSEWCWCDATQSVLNYYLCIAKWTLFLYTLSWFCLKCIAYTIQSNVHARTHSHMSEVMSYWEMCSPRKTRVLSSFCRWVHACVLSWYVCPVWNFTFDVKRALKLMCWGPIKTGIVYNCNEPHDKLKIKTYSQLLSIFLPFHYSAITEMYMYKANTGQCIDMNNVFMCHS